MTPITTSKKGNNNSGIIEYSPALDLQRNRDKKDRKGAIKMEDAKFQSPAAPTSSSSTKTEHFEIPKMDTLRLKPIKTLSSRIDGSVCYEESQVEKIQEMLEIGRIDEAILYADALYSKFVKEDGVDIVALADYIKILTVLRQWQRISHLILTNNFQQIHIVFAYYAALSLFQRKLYEDVIDLKIGHLIPNASAFHLPIKSPSHITGRSVEEERMKYSFKTMSDLDSVARKLGLAHSLTLIFAESFLKLMNRESAMICISYTAKYVKTPFLVERVIKKYNLVEESELHHYKLVRKKQFEHYDGVYNPSILIEKAEHAYEMGRFMEAKKLTDVLFEKFGPHQNCMILRIHCMTMLKDSRGLLDLGHSLVSENPHVPLPWYCVALYYYTIGANSRARNYISKCTMMDTTFAEAWVAFGHILHYEVEHEQSMSCYYRASKLVDQSSEPFLYVALQYSTHSQKLSKKFMNEALLRSPKDPLIKHEQASIAYSSKDYNEAYSMFLDVLYLITDSSSDTSIEEVLRFDIEDFWKPLINNLGHVSRKMKKYKEAIMFHQRAIKMEPKFVDAIASIAMCYGVMGDIIKATEFFNRALAIDPFNETIRQCMSKMILAEKTIYEIEENINTSLLEKDIQHQLVIPKSSLRKPKNDSMQIPSVPEFDEPFLTLSGN